MKRRDLASSIVLLAMGLTIILGAWKLPFGGLREPDIGFFPFILGFLLAILSLLLLWDSIRQKSTGKSSNGVQWDGLKRTGLAAAALFAFTALFEPLGYLICTFLLISFFLFTLGSQKWWVATAIGVLSSLFSFLLFDLLLAVPLPAGLLKF